MHGLCRTCITRLLAWGSILEGPIALSNMVSTTKVVGAPPLSRFVLKRLQKMGHGICKQSTGSGTRHKQAME